MANLSHIKGIETADDKTLEGLNDIANIGIQAAHLPGSGMDQLRAIFEMMENYKITNPDTFKAADDFIGERCAYRNEDLF